VVAHTPTIAIGNNLVFNEFVVKVGNKRVGVEKKTIEK
jgi:hypothetical protein